MGEARIWSMNFNLVGSLLAVSSGSGRGTVHVFKLGAHGSSQNSPRLENGNPPHSPPESVDGTTPGLEGGYEAFVEKKKSGGGGVRCVSLLPFVFFFRDWCSSQPHAFMINVACLFRTSQTLHCTLSYILYFVSAPKPPRKM